MDIDLILRLGMGSNIMVKEKCLWVMCKVNV